MANIKINASNYDNKLNDWKNNVGATRADILHFVPGELNPADIQQVAWKKNLIVSIEAVNEFVSKITYVDILT